jgi:hypothetical protein
MTEAMDRSAFFTDSQDERDMAEHLFGTWK